MCLICLGFVVRLSIATCLALATIEARGPAKRTSIPLGVERGFLVRALVTTAVVWCCSQRRAYRRRWREKRQWWPAAVQILFHIPSRCSSTVVGGSASLLSTLFFLLFSLPFPQSSAFSPSLTGLSIPLLSPCPLFFPSFPSHLSSLRLCLRMDGVLLALWRREAGKQSKATERRLKAKLKNDDWMDDGRRTIDWANANEYGHLRFRETRRGARISFRIPQRGQLVSLRCVAQGREAERDGKSATAAAAAATAPMLPFSSTAPS
ncbi:hypothetical protein IWX49DRAFT_12097 [Phyllosticta citricarpa]